MSGQLPLNVLSAKSLKLLEPVDERLRRLAIEARRITSIPFEITEGLRSEARQKYLYETGKSRTMQSKHLTGHAFDFVAMPGGKVSWLLADYRAIVDRAFKTAERALQMEGIFDYGCYWHSIVDGPHCELKDGR